MKSTQFTDMRERAQRVSPAERSEAGCSGARDPEGRAQKRKLNGGIIIRNWRPGFILGPWSSNLNHFLTYRVSEFESEGV